MGIKKGEKTMMIPKNDWSKLLIDEFEKPYFQQLRKIISKEYQEQTVYPPAGDIFNALNLTTYSGVRVVILGQDPYHGMGQAHGLSFSVQSDIAPPPSLKNIFKELQSDIQCTIPNHGCLEHWAKQGVLLLNTVLTVRDSQPNSHQGLGWEIFTDQIIRLLDQREQPLVFILWGKHAQKKQKIITNGHHLTIQAPHPSPLSARRGFFGSKPFSITNDFLRTIHAPEIDWQIP